MNNWDDIEMNNTTLVNNIQNRVKELNDITDNLGNFIVKCLLDVIIKDQPKPIIPTFSAEAKNENENGIDHIASLTLNLLDYMTQHSEEIKRLANRGRDERYK